MPEASSTQRERVSPVLEGMLGTGTVTAQHSLYKCSWRSDITYSVTSMTNSAGSSASNYGNGIKDATNASGPRSQTAQNPLGTSGNSYGGKKVVAGIANKGSSGMSKGAANNPLGLS